QDHYATRVNWRLKNTVTLNESSRGARLGWEALKYAIARRGVLTYTAGIAHGFVKTRDDLETPDVQFHFAHASYKNPKDRKLDTSPGMTAAICQLRPESVGSIHIKSTDPFVAPAIRPNFLSTDLDCSTIVAGLRIARALGEAPAFDPYRDFEMNPGRRCESDEDLLEYARESGATVYHPVGTCKMGQDPMAVVDERLRVHGLQSLRVVDASIMPRLVSGNTNAPTIMVAEKAADMILHDFRAG
ncbi:MAG: GMC oxidoreductase, partial [Pseudomonadota bacterium]